MKNIVGSIVIAGLMVGIVTACAAPPTRTLATPQAFSLPTLIPPTSVPPTPTAIPTATPSPTPVPPTPASSPTSAGTIAAAASPAPATPIPTATHTPVPSPVPSPTLGVPPGLYVTEMRIDPPPMRGLDLSFYPMFLNTLDREQNYRWTVYIFRADTQKRIGETSLSTVPIPPGSNEMPSIGSWRWPLGGPCEFFYAQVGWFNDENKVVWFANTNSTTFQKGFTACPP